MNAKPLNGNRVRLAQAATGISPADYLLGSLESRAAARALLDQAERMKPSLSEHDRDALTIYRGTFWLHGPASPSHQELEGTAIYQRGRELAGTYHSENKDGRKRGRELLKELVGFEIPTDLRELSDDQLEALMAVHLVIFVCRQLPELQQAWFRHLGNLPFPIRVEGTRFLYRTWKGKWEEREKYSAALQQFATRMEAAP